VETNYTTYEETNHNQNWGEEFTVVKKLDIIQTIQQIITKDLPTYRLKNDQCYYVYMP